MPPGSTKDLDVAICGGGPVGMALALALSGEARDCVLLDARSADHDKSGRHRDSFDPRTLALSYGSRLMLERLGVWDELGATPISRIHVSQQGGFGCTVLDAADENVPALGYVVAFSALDAELRRACASRVRMLEGAQVTAISHADDRAVIAYARKGKDHRLRARLVAVADGGGAGGGNGGSAGDDDKDRVERDYRQTAIVADVTPGERHRNQAWERFARNGPIALLPKGGDYALVWSVSPAEAAELTALADEEFLGRLTAAMGGRTGRLTAVSRRSQFPLGLRYRRELAGERTLNLGNAAQTLHPVAGQGLNLGLRDVWALMQALKGVADCGDAGVLADYSSRRRIDRFGTIRFTDLLARVFTVDSALMRAGRGAALTLFDLVPPARHFLARRMIFGASAWP